MTYEYDFEMVKRAYAEMARRAREKDELRRPARTAANPMPTVERRAQERQPQPA